MSITLSLHFKPIYSLFDVSPGLEDSQRLVWTLALTGIPMDVQLFPSSSTGVRGVLAEGPRVHVYDFDFRASTSASPEPRHSFTLPCPMYSAHLNSDRSQIVCGGEDHLIYRLDANTGEILGKLPGFSAYLLACSTAAPHCL